MRNQNAGPIGLTASCHRPAPRSDTKYNLPDIKLIVNSGRSLYAIFENRAVIQLNEEVCRFASIGIWLRDVLTRVDPGDAGYTLRPAEPDPMALLASQRKATTRDAKNRRVYRERPRSPEELYPERLGPLQKEGAAPPSFCKNNGSPSIFAIVFPIITSIPMVLPFSFHAV